MELRGVEPRSRKSPVSDATSVGQPFYTPSGWWFRTDRSFVPSPVTSSTPRESGLALSSVCMASYSPCGLNLALEAVSQAGRLQAAALSGVTLSLAIVVRSRFVTEVHYIPRLASSPSYSRSITGSAPCCGCHCSVGEQGWQGPNDPR